MHRQLMIAATLLACVPAAAQDDIFAGRPAFSLGDQPAQSVARCEDVRSMSAGLPKIDYRIDLAVTGELRLVRTDGALWYLVICSDVRVMCVTYESNDMKNGDTVIFRGNYRRLDDDHVMLDPCLASI